MDLQLPTSSTDKNGLIRKNSNFVANIDASSFVSAENVKHYSNLISYSSSNKWSSQPDANSYFNITFTKPVYVTNYSVEVLNWGEVNAYPVSWYGTGTYKGKETLISNVTSAGLSYTNLARTFKTKKSGPFIALKFTMTGKTTNGLLIFCVYKFDIEFGKKI